MGDSIVGSLALRIVPASNHSVQEFPKAGKRQTLGHVITVSIIAQHLLKTNNNNSWDTVTPSYIYNMEDCLIKICMLFVFI